MIKKNTFKILLCISPLLGYNQAIGQMAPRPYGVLPTQRQLKWQETEMYALVHFTPTTFQNKEWGYGEADPVIFNPTEFNANQIVNAVKAGGFKGLTFVAKHHDGFALWPTKTTPYNISKSPFRNGKGDMVKEMMEACKKAELKFGLYCSPWDRNNPNYGNPEYISKVYYPQLNELYSNYGKLFTVFFDGANGGDGYYGGAKEKRSIDASSYYNFDKIWGIVRSKQPDAVIFSDIGPDIRWVGNEKGIAAETSWATFTPKSPQIGKKPAPGFVVSEELPEGTRNGKYWIPAECDVPLRPGWFYHKEQDNHVKSVQTLLDLYYKSVGRGASLDLGISPMPSGLLNAIDVANLKSFGDIIRKTFSKNLAVNSIIKASNTRSNSLKFSANMLFDNDRYSYWATDDKITNPEVMFTMSKKIRFNVIRLRENIKLGQRIEECAIDIWKNGQWQQIATATSIGGNRLIRLSEYFETNKVRLRIIKSPVCVVLSDFGLFAEPEDAKGDLVSAKEKELPKLGWKEIGSSGKSIDGDVSTLWESDENEPKRLTIDLGDKKEIKAFTYMPRQDKKYDGIIDQYIYAVSNDGLTWTHVAEGEFSNIVNNPITQLVTLSKPVIAKYFRLEAKRLVKGNKATVAEIGVK